MIRQGTKLWSKFAPGLTATVVANPDYRGVTMAWHTDPESPTGQCSSLINVEEWSETELVPTPESVPAVAYLVITGTVDDPLYLVVDNELDAARRLDLLAYTGEAPLGYARILIERAMVAPQEN